GGVVASAPATPVLGPTGPLDPEELLTRHTCATCHAVTGQSPLGPSYEGMGSRLTADEIRTSILDPTASAAEGFEAMLGLMPPIFGNIPAAELEAIVQFIASQR
ncbi:MAG: cytochrome c, partial [Gammaproteobacteria bacterium]|nr:cytochrome c [Gammaproteobacteria bacterium]